MANLDYNRSFCPVRTRKLIIQKWLEGEEPQQIANRYDGDGSGVATSIDFCIALGAIYLLPFLLSGESKFFCLQFDIGSSREKTEKS